MSMLTWGFLFLWENRKRLKINKVSYQLSRTQGRNTIGVRGIRPRAGDYVVALAIVDPQKTLLVASENLSLIHI